MSDIESKVREYGQKRATKNLQKYIDDLPTDEILNVIKTGINRQDFSSFLNYLLLAFTDTTESHEKRFRVFETVLEELFKRNVSTSNSNTITTRLSMELEKLKSEHLVALCSVCTERIQKGNIADTSWQELLPKLLQVLIERECVEYNDITVTGLEYKTQYVNSLCMLQWSPNIVIPLTAMFIEIPLMKDEHLQVVSKLGQYMEKLTCQEIPSFVYQFLKLCQYQNGRSIFLLLQNYFGIRIYNRVQKDNNFTSSETIDLIDDTLDDQAIQAESTVLFHIYQSALHGYDSIKDYLSSLKNLTKSPEFVLHPFQLTALLTISTVTFYEDRVFTIIRTCISRNFHEEIKKSESLWFKDMIPLPVNMNAVIKQIIEFSVQERDLVLQGLVNLGFILLGVGLQLGKNTLVEKQWTLGKFILLSLIKQKPHIAHAILQRLCNCIISGQNASQCIDCFHSLTRKFALITLENKSCVVELMEALLQASGSVATSILDAVIPLTKLSPTIRDHLILLLRKALYSRITETRQMAVKGFLKMLKNLKISNMAALSQMSSSNSSTSHSILTQISLTRAGQSATSAFTNEALCFELLGILRRCFMQQAEVRARLYDGLYDAVCMNPDIGEPVLNLLWSHFGDYYVIDQDVLPPLQFSKIALTKDVDVTLQEPLGKLIHTFGIIVTKVLESDEENASAAKFAKILGSLCDRMSKCELVHLELDDGTNLLDVLPECQQKLIILKEAMCVYEALIGFKLSSWRKTSENYAQDVNRLFQGYSRLLQFFKNLSKPRKGGRKKKDVNKTTTQQSESSSKHDSQLKAKSIKLSNTLLDMRVLIKILHLLHGNVNWTTVSQANLLKPKHGIHRHMMQATIQQFQAIKNEKFPGHHDSKLYYNYCTDVGSILYERCIVRFEDFLDFDCTTAILTLDCFHIILQLICSNYHDDLKLFLSLISGNESEEDFLVQLKSFIEIYQKLFELDEDDAPTDPEIKKLPQIILSTLTLLVEQIPTEINDLSIQFLDWMKQFACRKTVNNKLITTNFATLWFNTYLKFKSGTMIFEKIVDNLHEVAGTMGDAVEVREKFNLVNELSAHSLIQCLTHVLKVMLDDAEWIISRLRSEYLMFTYPGEQGSDRRREYLKNKERGTCCHMCLLISLVNSLCNVLIPTGVLSENVLKVLALLYNTLNSLAKYFLLRSTKVNVAFQPARFEAVVKMVGKQLSPNVHKFILNIEDMQKEEMGNPDVKKKSVDSLKTKVLRETKLIPKVVFEIEQLSKTVIQLSNKTKVDLSKFIGQGTTRDFRIKDLKSVMEKNQGLGDVSLSTDVPCSNQTVDDNSNSESDECPPSKKSKI